MEQAAMVVRRLKGGDWQANCLMEQVVMVVIRLKGEGSKADLVNRYMAGSLEDVGSLEAVGS